MVMNEGELSAGLAPTSNYRYADRVGGRLFVAGQVPVDSERTVVGGDDAAAQAAQCLRNLFTLVEHHGFSRDDIHQLLQQLAQASKQANETLAQTNLLVRNANGLVDNQARAALESARSAMASLDHSAADIDRLLSDNRAAINGGLQGFSELGPAVRELRDAAG